MDGWGWRCLGPARELKAVPFTYWMVRASGQHSSWSITEELFPKLAHGILSHLLGNALSKTWRTLPLPCIKSFQGSMASGRSLMAKGPPGSRAHGSPHPALSAQAAFPIYSSPPSPLCLPNALPSQEHLFSPLYYMVVTHPQGTGFRALTQGSWISFPSLTCMLAPRGASLDFRRAESTVLMPGQK